MEHGSSSGGSEDLRSAEVLQRAGAGAPPPAVLLEEREGAAAVR